MISQFDFDNLRSLSIGTVDSVSPSEIKVQLDIDAPQNTALNTGTPSLFPRINGFVLIPNEIGALVGLISWIGVEHSPYPKRKGFKDYDIIDLPFPMRKMCVNPIGTLKQVGKVRDKNYKLERGVYSFPSIGDSVILPSEFQLKSIVENRDKNANVCIGTSTVAGGIPVMVDPDKMFGRHLAILGNTGSGKSCTVAGLVRWSLESADKMKVKGIACPNARFVILDPNGEYTSAFDGIGKKVRKFKIKLNEEKDGTEDLRLPAWMWNSQEWINFSQAAPGAQRPLLLDALVGLRAGRQANSPLLVRLNRFIIGHLRLFEGFLAMPPASMAWGDRLNCGRQLNDFNTDGLNYIENLETETLTSFVSEEDKQALITNLQLCTSNTLQLHTTKRFPWQNTFGFNAFTEVELRGITSLLNKIVNLIPEGLRSTNNITADSPVPFQINDLPNLLVQLADAEGNNLNQFISLLTLRLRFLFDDNRLKSVVDPNESISLENWLQDYIGANNAENGQISILDLSLIPSDIVHIIVAVLSRLIFEAIQRYRRKTQEVLPTVVVLEEAHTYIKDAKFDETRMSQLCREIFEKISREGRKFGLSLVLSSQRPSELSDTVLSQCNTFILHRIVNDRDQELVRRLVPDNIGGLLKELPILPTRKAILLGWASAIPILFEVKELKPEQLPNSKDPEFWDVWTGKLKRDINWKELADEWQSNTSSTEESGDNREGLGEDGEDAALF